MSRLRKLGRRGATGLVVGLLLVLLVVEGIVLWLQTPSGNHFLRRTTEDLVTGLMGEGELRIGALSTDLFTRLSAEDVALVDGQGRPVLQLAWLGVDWRASGLLQRQVVLDRVVLERPVVDLETDAQGVLDLVRLFPSDPDAPPAAWEGLPVDIVLGELIVSDGRIAYTDGEAHVAVEQLGIRLRASTDGRDVSGDSLVIEGQLTAPLALPLSVRGDVSFVGGDLLLDGVVAAVGEDAVRLDAVVRSLEDTEALTVESLQIRGQGLDLDRIEGWVGDLGLGGLVGLEVDVSGPLDAVVVDARVETAEGQASASATLDLAGDTPTWTARVEIDGCECQGLVDAVTESLLLNAALELQGTGLAFPDGVDATGTLVAGPSIIWGYPLEGGTAALRWTEGQGWVDAIAVDMGWGTAAGSGELTLDGLDLAVRAQVSDLQRLAVFGVEGIGGQAQAQGDLRVDWSGAEAEVGFHGTTDASAADVQGTVQIDRYTGTVHTSVIGADVEVSGAGRASGVNASGAVLGAVDVDWTASVREDGAFRWTADLVGGPLDVAGFLGVTRIEGRATGEDDGVSEPRILAELGLVDAHLGAILGDQGQLVVGLQGDALRASLQLLEAGEPRLTLRASGDLGTGWFEVPRLELQPPDAAPWVNPKPLRAHVVEGGVEDLFVVLGSAAGQLAITGHYLEGESVDLLLAVDGLHLDWIEALVQDSTAGWGGEAAASLRLVGGADQARLDAQLAVADLVVPGQLESVDVELGLGGTGDALALDLRLSDDGQALAWGGGTVPFSVDLDTLGPVPEGLLDLHLEGGPWDLVELGRHVPALAGLGEGQASGALDLGGTLVAPEIQAALGVELGVGAPAEFLRVDVDLDIRDGQVTLHGTAGQAGTTQVLLNGTALTGLSDVLLGALVEGEPQPDTALTATWLSALDVRVVPVNVDLAVWSRALGLDTKVQGLMAGGIRLTGTVDRPEVAAGLQVANMVLGEVPVAPALVALAPDAGGYRATLLMGAGDGHLSVGGLVPFDREREGPLDLDAELARDGLDLEVSGTAIPLALLQLFDPGITEPSGVLEIAGVVTGSVAEPDPVVSFSVVDGSFNYEPLLIRYTDLDLFVVLDHQDLSVERGSVLTEPMYTDTRTAVRELTQNALDRTGVSGQKRAERTEPLGGIQLAGSGQLGLDGLSQVRLDVGANFAWIMDTTAIKVAYTGDVAVTGDWPDLAVDGDLELNKFRYALDARTYLGQEGLRLDDSLAIQRPGYVHVPPPPREPEFWESWDIRSRIDLGFNTKLKVEIPLDTSYGTLTASASSVQFDSFVRGQLDATLRGYDAYAEGAVETYEGTTRILGKVFKIDQGLVTFAGSDIANPALEIQAVHETSQYGDISVRISNNVEQMAMQFDSSNGWSETDIVAILLLGRPTTQLSTAEGGGSVEALDIALGMVAGQVEKLAGDSLVDTIEIETSSEAALEGVKVGWALGRNMFFTLNYTATTDDDENKVEGTLEYIWREGVHFSGTTGDQGQTAIEVFKVWKF